jgi:hypothetical protein
MVNSLTGFKLAQSGVDLSSTSGGALSQATAAASTPTAFNPNSSSQQPQSPQNRAVGLKTLRYPNKAIKESDDYLEIKIVRYIPPAPNASGSNVTFTSSTQLLNQSDNLKKPEAIIILPMPQDLQDSNSVDWGDSSLNAMEMAGVKSVGEGMQEGNVVTGGIKTISGLMDAAKGLGSSGNVQDLAQSFFSAQLVNMFGGNVDASSLLSRSTGQVLNPNMELLFKGVGLREFSFNFDFVPKDPNEAGVVKDIIRTFKTSMAPRSSAGGGNGLFISAPNVFVLEYKSGGRSHPFLNRFKPMAMKGMSVNYTGSGTYAVYNDSTPIHMKLSLNFQELNPIYFEDYQGVGGVGY